MIYPRDDERAIRRAADGGGLDEVRIAAAGTGRAHAGGLQVDYRRTNRFLRITLFLFGLLIINAVVGLFAVMLDLHGRVRYSPADRLRCGLRPRAVGDRALSPVSLWHRGSDRGVRRGLFRSRVCAARGQRFLQPAAVSGPRRCCVHHLQALRVSVRGHRGSPVRRRHPLEFRFLTGRHHAPAVRRS